MTKVLLALLMIASVSATFATTEPAGDTTEPKKEDTK
jgi:hypothetical protein